MTTRKRCVLALLLGTIWTSEAAAQIIGVPVLVPSGIDFRFKAGNLRINGFIPTGGATMGIVVPPGTVPPLIVPVYPNYYYQYPGPLLGSVNQRYNLTIINPPGIPLRQGFVPFPDVSGIDLDKEPPSKIWGEKPAIAKAPAPPPKEVAKVEKPAPQVAAANQAKPAALPKAEGERFLDLGVAAFKNGEYGLALRWFREARESDRPPLHAAFYLGQAYLAVGKYREAAAVIRDALETQNRWPFHAFKPKAELYDNDVAEFNQHRKQLDDALKGMPKNEDHLFLLGYWCWFDDQRDAAVDYFQQASAVAADPAAAQLFLRAAKKK